MVVSGGRSSDSSSSSDSLSFRVDSHQTHTGFGYNPGRVPHRFVENLQTRLVGRPKGGCPDESQVLHLRPLFGLPPPVWCCTDRLADSTVVGSLSRSFGVQETV